MRRLEGRVAMVTGGANGIGRGCALRLAEEGAALAVVDREADTLEALTAEVEALGGTIFTRAADCTSPDAARAFVADAETHFGKIDVLVNNVGQGARERKSSFLDSDEEVWRFVLEINLLTTMRFSRHVAPGMVGRKHGRIINMASEAFLTGPVGSHDYAAAKGGIVGFTRSVARELAPNGVTVNALLPGPIMTRALSTSNDPVVHETMKSVPVGFVGEPEDIAAMAALLASDEGRFITGQSIVVNGGRWWV
ncbi:SDR family NAD(P)-dependent oxidoreductase [Sphingomonas sp. AOB5]|uniref:SDR family NAD(P)-dependent oxidoreductase n=1 Tax=Sphingomonas sp. AOB5 TaxID=3034017 RepID=UPI0023F6D253|nr:SDR family NAD(P)-dependent oxidoreductase [Sphingomonas sp. AOB5]MDF7776708.1 SDR family NAD(P)-dependent oxidoreductase [Sphingomonas sp. AOB5]